MRVPSLRRGAAVAFARAGVPPRATPWREAKWCAVDLELTGLHPRKNDIIAVGAVPIEDGRIVLGQCFYTLVRTAKRSEPGAVLVHKLRVADLVDAPVLRDALEQVLQTLTGRVPVFHSAAVERNFLRPLFARRLVRMPAAADTDVLGRVWLRERDGVAPSWLPLGKLASVLGQPAEIPHHALGDALTTAKAFIALASHLDTIEPQTVGSLVGAGDRLEGPRRFGA